MSEGPLVYPLAITREAILLELTVDGDPVPWARAGRSRAGKSYTPARYAAWHEAVGWAMREGYTGKPAGDELGVWLTFRRRTRRRVDLDNLCKAVLDAGSGIVWADDAQVTLLLGRLLIEPAAPGVELVVYRRRLEGVPSAP